MNKYLPHIHVLPEDEANTRLVNGFLLEPSVLEWKVKVLDEAGGWRRVLELFKSVHIFEMERWPKRFMILLIDLDGDIDRLEIAKKDIPEHLADRVFVLCSLKEPEDLKADLGISPEEIGQKMAKDCRDDTDKTWGHSLLQHNAGELDRLREHVRPILFQSI